MENFYLVKDRRTDALSFMVLKDICIKVRWKQIPTKQMQYHLSFKEQHTNTSDATPVSV